MSTCTHRPTLMYISAKYRANSKVLCGHRHIWKVSNSDSKFHLFLQVSEEHCYAKCPILSVSNLTMTLGGSQWHQY